MRGERIRILIEKLSSEVLILFNHKRIFWSYFANEGLNNKNWTKK